ncbi:Hypothetical protein KVN_LOCUS310 [uncultured virus]|nr:Hypothetical protein KVN_LOCUS310 [uncultured virus]
MGSTINDLDFGLNESEDQLSDNFFDSKNDYTNIDLNILIDIKENEMINPFFVSVFGNKVYKMDKKELYSANKYVLILCRKNGCESINLTPLLNKIIDKEIFKQLLQFLTIIKISSKILKIYNHIKYATKLTKDILSLVNTNQYRLNEEEILVPIFELNEKTVKTYLKLFDDGNKFEDLIKIIILQQYFNFKSDKNPVNKKLSTFIMNLKGNEFWNSYNCKLNMTQLFSERTFRYIGQHDKLIKAKSNSDNSTIKDPEAKKLYDKIINQKKDYTNLNKDPFYKKEKFTDLSSIIVKDGFKLYKLDYENLPYTKDQIIELFRLIKDEKILFDLFNSLLLSKSFCHYVINNYEILEIMKHIINKYLPIYRYIFGYTWLYMYMEECIVKTNTKQTNRYVFNINTASKLPFFPYCSSDIHLNPYLPVLVSSKVLKSDLNCLGLAMIRDYNDYGIENLDGFRQKLNIFTTGQVDKCIFDGLETFPNSTIWKSFAVSGSIIPACCQKRNPLIDLVTQPGMVFTEKWNRYFNEYYHESDIDIMCNKLSMFDYLDELSKLIEVVKTNINILAKKDVSNTLIIEPIKSLIIVVHVDYIKECLKEFDESFVIENLDKNEIKELFYELYVTNKSKINRKLRSKLQNSDISKNPLYEHFYKLVPIDEMNIILTTYQINKSENKEYDSEFYLYKNDIITKDVETAPEKNLLLLKISENVKFKIKSPHLSHSIEVFKTKYSEFFSCVARFHLPCVRGYYNGNDVYLLPSCISALMTNINIDYKYFAGIRDPIDIINKYRIRGFGTLLNEKEKSYVIDFNSRMEKWQNIFEFNAPKSIKFEHMGSKSLNNNMFKPGKFFQGFPDEVYTHIDHNYIFTIEDLVSQYKNLSNYDPKTSGLDLFKFKTINEEGFVEPIKKWLLDASYDILSNNIQPITIVPKFLKPNISTDAYYNYPPVVKKVVLNHVEDLPPLDSDPPVMEEVD